MKKRIKQRNAYEIEKMFLGTGWIIYVPSVIITAVWLFVILMIYIFGKGGFTVGNIIGPILRASVFPLIVILMTFKIK